jgi:hypothetical protein
MASTSVSPEPDDPGGAAARRHLERLTQDFTPIQGVHEHSSETSRHCRSCTAHFGMGTLFPCLSYKAEQSPGRHGGEDADAGAEQC